MGIFGPLSRRAGGGLSTPSRRAGGGLSSPSRRAAGGPFIRYRNPLPRRSGRTIARLGGLAPKLAPMLAPMLAPVRAPILLLVLVLAAPALVWPGGAAAQALPISSKNDLCALVPAGSGSVDSVEMVQATAAGPVNRYYCVWQPSGFSPGAGGDHRLLVVLHGGDGHAGKLAVKGLQSLAETRGYLIAFAQGWPHGDCPGALCTQNVWFGTAEINGMSLELGAVNRAYVAQLVDAALGDYGTDPAGIYLAGFSGGAKLIYSLVAGDTMALPFPFEPAGLATMAGSLLSVDVPETPGTGRVNAIHVGAGARPVPALLMQGMEDAKLAFEGGLNAERSAIDAGFRAKIAMFRALNDAMGAGLAQPAQWLQPLAGNPAELRQYDGAAMVVSVGAETLDHRWPDWFAPLVFDFFDAH